MSDGECDQASFPALLFMKEENIASWRANGSIREQRNPVHNWLIYNTLFVWLAKKAIVIGEAPDVSRTN